MTRSTENGRIDVHHHIVPPFYADWLRSKGMDAGGMPIPGWSAADSIAVMDEHHIAAAVLSVSTPGVHLGDDAEARGKAREVNEFAAEVVKDRPDRFGFLATLTLPDVDGALAEAAYAFDELRADGIVLLANVQGRYLGNADFAPLLAELDRRAATVLIHPSQLPAPPLDELPPFAADFLLDTTRTAADLVRAGAVRRYPSLRMILSHAGGFLPYAAHRIAITLAFTGGRTIEDVLADLSSFYFDTALSGTPSALPSLLAFADPSRVLFGTDWPYAPALAVDYFTGHLDAYTGLDDQQRAAIDHANAVPLFPRLTQKA